jgi:ABC-type transport system involved in multi-copper enzyme maturation permease subunit
MMPLLRAEFRKLMTIRSTYILLGVATLIVGFLAFWITGHNSQGTSSNILSSAATDTAGGVAVFLAIISILLVTHEYRYNTIMYTLTAANSRSKVLAAKLLVMLAFATVATLAFMVFAVFMAWLGVVTGGDSMMHQYIYIWDIVWRSLFYSLAWVAVGMLFGLLFRHIVGAIIVLFIVPSTVEGLLSLLLKENSKYLPFMSLEQVMSPAGASMNGITAMGAGKAALLFSVYLVAGWAIAWFLFLKRDAN